MLLFFHIIDNIGFANNRIYPFCPLGTEENICFGQMFLPSTTQIKSYRLDVTLFI